MSKLRDSQKFYNALAFVGRNAHFKLAATIYKQESIPLGCVPPTLQRTGVLHDRDSPGQRPPWTDTPWTDTPWTETPGRNMGPGSQTGNNIIQRSPLPVNRMTGTPVKILPCPKLLLRAVTM